LTYAFVSWEGN